MGSSGGSSGGKNSWDDYLFPFADVDDDWTEKIFQPQDIGFHAGMSATNNLYKTLSGEDDFGDHSSWMGASDSPFNNVVSSWLNPGYENRQDWKAYYEKQQAETQEQKDNIDAKRKKDKKKNQQSLSTLFKSDDDKTTQSILT